MSFPAPLNIAIEQGIELLLKLDPDTRGRLHSLDDKLIRINVTSPEITLALSITGGRAYVVDSIDKPADTTITGSLAALRSLIRGNDALYRGEVTIEGDISAGQQIKQIIGGIDPDWEEWISPLLGDAAAHRLGSAGRQFGGWLERTRSSLQQDLSEYLQEESYVLAPNSEVREFCGEVDELRAAADRLAARVKRLERLAAGSGSDPDSSDVGANT